MKKNEIESFVEIWMDLESVLQSKVNQREKNKYCILTHIYMEFRKMVPMKSSAGQEKLKSRDITLPTKICLVKAMVFPVVIMDVRVGP